MLNFIKRIRIRKERAELFRVVQAFVRVRFRPKHEVSIVSHLILNPLHPRKAKHQK